MQEPLLPILLVLYFLPTIIALFRNRDDWGEIFILNLFLGWTCAGWVVAMILACVKKRLI